MLAFKYQINLTTNDSEDTMTEQRKYPRTSHLPWSPGTTNDDRILHDLSHLKALNDFVTTVKMDGGNLTMTRSHFFARSLSSGTHTWDAPNKALWAQVHHEIPEGWRISGESMYAERSVRYEGLPSYYMVFGIWDENDVLLSWDATREWTELLGLSMVPELYRGDSFEDAVAAWSQQCDVNTSEGFVVRSAGTIPAERWPELAAKWVRKDHVTTTAAWRGRDDFPVNGLAS